MIDLMSIARTEADGGDLFGNLQALYEPTEVRPDGHPEAVVWSGGNFVAMLIIGRLGCWAVGVIVELGGLAGAGGGRGVRWTL